jgi:hypothetical protein
MARTSISSRVVVRERYFWPQGQLNLWTLIVLATGSTILGVFAEFMVIQNQMNLFTPWYVPFFPWMMYRQPATMLTDPS